MAKIVAFSGVSNSGKTTLIEKLCRFLSSKFNVCVIKHDPKNKACIDKEGKDSFKFFEAGASVAITSANRTTFLFQDFMDMQKIISVFSDAHYIFIEGLKELDFPRICVARDEIHQDYIRYSQAFAIDISVKNTHILPPDMLVLDLNNIEQILEWIDKNALRSDK